MEFSLFLLNPSFWDEMLTPFIIFLLVEMMMMMMMMAFLDLDGSHITQLAKRAPLFVEVSSKLTLLWVFFCS
jgi:hypothetical protein